jgi:hypothetical protein
VYGTFGARGLAFLERTFLKALQRIIYQLRTFRAQIGILVTVMTVKGDHQHHGFAFPVQPVTFPGHYEIDYGINRAFYPA